MMADAREGLLEHARLEEALLDLHEALLRPELELDVLALFRLFAMVFRKHLMHEESMIAEYAWEAPEEAEFLLADHTKLCAQLDALEAKAREGSLLPAEILDLKIKVMIHEAREKKSLYVWAALPRSDS
jgi:hypothetical protein